MSQYICYHEAEFHRGQLAVIALGGLADMWGMIQSMRYGV